MTPKFDNGVVRLYQGDARLVLRELPAESVHMVCCSPPYWGLRDYGLEPLVWGGDERHEHEWGEAITVSDRHFDKGTSTLSGSNANQMSASTFAVQGAFCLCGAWRGSLGLEPTIDLYVQHIVEIFREVWRVLRRDGTLWLNMGDSYAGSQQGIGADGTAYAGPKQATNAGSVGIQAKPRKAHEIGLKPKDLCMMPARVALALQADGWWLRSDIVWSKLNPMPESVTDRPTRSHEYLFLLTKAERYFYDADAIREPVTGNAHGRGDGVNPKAQQIPSGYDTGPGPHGNVHQRPRQNASFSAAVSKIVHERNKRSVWEIATEPMGYEWCRGCGMVYTTGEYRRLSAGAARRCTTELDDSGDNKCGGTSWEALENGCLVCIACEVEYPKSVVDKMPRAAQCRRCELDDAWGSHFATFPQKLVEPCILAGTSERGACADCGAPWERVVVKSHEPHPNRWSKIANAPGDYSLESGDYAEKGSSAGFGVSTVSTTTGSRPTCECGHEETVPGTVLDPFAGSGTVAFMAQRLGRRAIGIDLSGEYLVLAEKRILTQTLPMTLT